jgi:ribonuclease P protein component
MIKSLKSDKKIKKIFDDGFTIKSGVLCLRGYDFKDDEKLFGVSVPKKNFKLAVKRNLLKRRLRESIRKNKSLEKIKNGVSFFLLYNSSKEISFEKLEAKTSILIEKLISEVN